MSEEKNEIKRHKNISLLRGIHPNFRFVLRKIAAFVLTVLIVTILSFLLMRLSPVDPAEAYVKRHTAIVTDEQIEAARIDLGLDQPLPVQYFTWLGDAVQLDFGISLEKGIPVSQKLASAIPVTLGVVGVSAIIMIVGVIVVGCLGYLWRERFIGRALSALCILGISIPAFYLAIVAIDVFAVQEGLFAVAGETGLMRYLPAALCLSVMGISMYGRMLTVGLESEMSQDYIQFARCRGLSEMRILVFHALPAAVIGLLPSFAQMIGLCLANAAIVERVFSLSGLGYTIIDAVIARDAPVIHASVLFLAVALVLLDIVAELLQNALSGHGKKESLEIAWA